MNKPVCEARDKLTGEGGGMECLDRLFVLPGRRFQGQGHRRSGSGLHLLGESKAHTYLYTMFPKTDNIFSL